MTTGDTMAKNLSSSELHAEHVELLPARTLVTALLVPVQTTGAGAGFVGAMSSGVDGAAGTQCPPWYVPKPPECY
jgi:hypothetical protein